MLKRDREAAGYPARAAGAAQGGDGLLGHRRAQGVQHVEDAAVAPVGRDAEHGRFAAQRGHRVGALQEMFEALDPSEIDELIRSTDELGMTPLLWSAKRGLPTRSRCSSPSAPTGRKSSPRRTPTAPRRSTTRRAAATTRSCSSSSAAGAPSPTPSTPTTSTPLHWAARKNNVGALRLLIAHGANLDVKNKWGATALDNAKFADHMEAIALLATDEATRRAAENKLILERKLRPTEEERAAKLAELAADALARREANKARLEGVSSIREAAEMATKEKAQLERRMRTADKALAAAIAGGGGAGGGKGAGGAPPWSAAAEQPDGGRGARARGERGARGGQRRDQGRARRAAAHRRGAPRAALCGLVGGQRGRVAVAVEPEPLTPQLVAHEGIADRALATPAEARAAMKKK